MSPECYWMERMVMNDTATLAKLEKEEKNVRNNLNKMKESGRLVAFGHIASVPVYVPSKNR